MLKVLVVDDSVERVELIKKALLSSEFRAHIDVQYSDTADKARVELLGDFTI